jgi:hypothetical protein
MIRYVSLSSSRMPILICHDELKALLHDMTENDINDFILETLELVGKDHKKLAAEPSKEVDDQLVQTARSSPADNGMVLRRSARLLEQTSRRQLSNGKTY